MKVKSVIIFLVVLALLHSSYWGGVEGARAYWENGVTHVDAGTDKHFDTWCTQTWIAGNTTAVAVYCHAKSNWDEFSNPDLNTTIWDSWIQYGTNPDPKNTYSVKTGDLGHARVPMLTAGSTMDATVQGVPATAKYYYVYIWRMTLGGTWYWSDVYSVDRSTTTQITSAPATVVWGEPVTIAVKVTGNGSGPTPTGNVTYLALQSPRLRTCVSALSGGVASCTIPLPDRIGTWDFTARYDGDTANNGSTATSDQFIVNKANTTTTITSATPDPSVLGSSYTVGVSVAAVAPGAGTPSGTVNVGDGTNTCSVTLASGSGSCSLPSSSVGAKTISAGYTGDTYFNTSTAATAAHTVNGKPSTTTITSDTPDPSVIGQNYAVSVSVAATSPYTGTPAGTVSVGDGTNTCSVTLASGSGSCSLPSTSTGAKAISAVYAGDASFNTSSAATAAHTVNKASTSTSIASDTPDPSVIGQSYAVSVSVAAAAPGAGTPTGSVSVGDGANTCSVTLASGSGSCNLPSTSVGAKTISAVYAGSTLYNTSTAATAAHTVNKASTTTTITSDLPDPSVTGQSYAVSVSVAAAAPGAGTPTGTVSVGDGANTCSVTLAGGSGSCNLPSTGVGAKTISAVYAGDTLFSTSTAATAAHTVNKASTTTTITSDTPDPTVTGQSYAVVVSVAAAAPGAGTPTGTVNVSDGANTCAVTLASGSGSCSLTSTSAGAKTISAVYAGDTLFSTSTAATAAHTVNKANTTTTITSDTPDPSVIGQNYAVSVSVAATAPGGGAPTGTVSVGDGTNTCSVTLASGSGSCSLTSTSVGAKTISAVYAGSTSYNTSAAATAAHTVNKASTTTAITSDTPDPTVIGQNYAVSVSVAAAAPGAGTPTGSVSVGDGTNTCTVTLTSGSGSCSLPSTSVGAKTISAAYAGSTLFNTSSAATAAHTVNQANSTTTITSDLPDPSVVGQNYAVSVSVAAAAPGTGTPTGSVSVGDGANTCTVTLASGSGSCNLPSTGVGAKTISAVYAGSTLFNTSTAVTAAHTVNKAATTTSIVDSPDPSEKGSTFTVTVTVSATAPGGGTPTGTVSVSDGTNTCPDISLVAGSGSCDLPSDILGTRTITASYSGDANYQVSSSTNGHTYKNLVPHITITSSSPNPSQPGQSYTVQFAATHPVSALIPSGDITISDGSATPDGSCSGTLDAGGAGSCSLISTTAGSIQLTATYPGDLDFSSGQGTAAHTVDQGSSLTQIDSITPAVTVVTGELYTVSASVSAVSPATVMPTGSILVSDGVGSTCTITLSAGTGSCELGTFTVGAKTISITASYLGDVNYAISEASASHDIKKADTAASITLISPEPSVNGQTFDVDVSVAAVSPGSGTPTGTVTVGDGSNTCAAVLSAGSGSCTLPASAPGTLTISASYGGDDNFNGSAAASASHSIIKADSSTSITASTAADSVVGEDYPVYVNVSAAAPGAGTPTGSVTVSDGVNTCTITALSAGAGDCKLPSIAASVVTLTASYNGDTKFNSSSTTQGHSIDPASTTTSIIAGNTDPTVSGQLYTISVSVAAVAPGKGTIAGTVLVGEGADTCTVTLSGGAGSCDLVSSTAGLKTITAGYAGSADFAASSADAKFHTVNQAATTTTITADIPDPTQIGQSYSISADVAADAPGAGSPSGDVAVDDGEGNSCLMTLSGGTGSCSLANSTGGVKTITATYQGDDDFLTSTNTETHTVMIDQAALTVVATPSTVAYGSTSALSSTGGNGTGAVTYSAGASNGCSVSGSTLSVTDASGICAVTATKAADSNYNSATSGAVSVTLTKIDQASLTAVAAPLAVAYGSTSALSSTGGNGIGAVTYSVGTSTGCSVTASTLSVTDASGTCAVTATKAADNNYNEASSAELSVTLTTADQATLTAVATPATVPYGSTSALTITGGGGTGAVTYSAGTSTGCSVSGSTLSVTDASGTCAVTATKAADNNYNEASSAELSVTLTTTDQASLTAVATPSTVAYGSNSALTTTGGSGTGAATYSAGTSTGCSVSGTTLSVTDASGTCAVTATKAADSNYNSATSAAISVTLTMIDQASLTAVATPSTVDYGSTSALSITGGDGTGEVTYSAGTSTGCSLSGSTLSVTDASGTCTVTATKAADSNYNSATSAAISVTLNKIDQASLTAVATPSTVAYGSTSALSSTGGNGIGAVTFSAGTSDGCSVSGSTLSVTDASGTCKITASKAADNNYNEAASAELSVTLATTDQASLTVVANPSTVAYGSTSALTTTGGSGTGAVTYSAGTSTGCSVSGSTLSVTDASGTCAVTATKAADNNYNEATSAELSVTLTTIDQASLTVVATPSTVAYGSTSALSITGGSGTGAVTYSAGASTGCSVSGSTLSVTDASGVCKITATKAADNNYNSTTSAALTVTLTMIDQASLTAVATPSTVAYGSTSALSITGGSGTGTVTYSAGASTGCSVSGTTLSVTDASGTCKITATKAADSNYNEATSAELSVTLTTADQATLSAVATPASVPYGSTSALSITGGSGTGEVTYSAGTSTGCSVSGSTLSVTDASGTCKITATKTADDNYNSATSAAIKVTLTMIDQASLTALATPSTVAYGSNSALSTTGGDGTGEVTFNAGTSDGCSVSGSTLSVTDASGACKITATKAADNNYNSTTSAALTVTLTTTGQSTLTVVATPSTVAYGSTSALSTTGGSGTGTVTYSAGASDGCSVSGSTLSVTDTSGTCKITATKAADKNYNEATSAALTLTLTRGDSSVTTWPTAGAITYGQTLADSTLSGGAATPAGSFAFTTPATAPEAGAALQGVTFTPTDTVNYKTATGTVSVSVDKSTTLITFDPAPTPVYLGEFTVYATTTNTDSAALTYSKVSGACAWVSGATFSATGADLCVVRASGAASSNFEAASQTQTISIGKAEPTLTWAAPADIVYGTVLGGAQLNASTGTVPGTLVYTPDAGTLLTVGTHTLHVDFTPTDTLNYSSTSKDASINIGVPPAPTITGLSLDIGPAAGGSIVVITGTYLTGGTVTFGGVAAACTVDSGTQMTCTTPAHNAGNVSIEITTPGGPSAPNSLFTYIQPVNPGIAPNFGPGEGGATVIISGAGFTGSSSATFGGSLAACSFVSGTQLSCVTAAHASGLVDVIITTGASVLAAPDGYTYLPAPVPGVSTGSGSSAGGTTVIITGSGFDAATRVSFGGTSADCTWISATQISCVTPAHAGGSVDIVITGAGAATLAGAFTYIQAELYADISPNYGPITGGTTVTITASAGANFNGATAVSFGGANAASFMVKSATQISAVTPVHAAGMVDIVVSAPAGTFTYARSFSFYASALPLALTSTPPNGSFRIARESPAKLIVTFNMDILHVASTDPGWPSSGTNPANYLLVSAGVNGVIDTQTCLSGTQGDDVLVTINDVSYTPATFTAEISVNNGMALPVGSYQLLVCGTTSIRSLAGVKLNGGLDDARFTFRITTNPAKPALLPATGFAPNQVTSLPAQSQAYAAMSDFWLEIPVIEVKMDIVGVPQSDGSWDVTWLGDDAGYLEGSAYPTHTGNSVMTGHVWDANNLPGPFINLKKLSYGDQIKIHAFGQVYTYEIRENKLVDPSNINAVMKHEELAWVTLVTCESYNESNDSYTYRRLVRAVLISVK